ncbi:DUF2489 domain-containing protein [Psychrobium sp. 1_MG-2023]|uniref:DUF2489 domain-containing protein n=1 Tax=Psychrobium sp. 1_MG-2023 TaxID=3062624 RepID=UPI000C32021A|nr:DUF2489 domain-containing protein [Psychrobium sp. 1_MG-2023]MDP2561032.1 DUF2489 domain-containing protein [Psychrobium sp. 1_MG-2023]PKF58325.1 DUF2489 domain-containing protein [Alteromonadales bacterium alter-6D02]
MDSTIIVLLVIGSLIIAGLAFYAGKLLAKLKSQQTEIAVKQQQHQQKIKAHNDKLVDSIQLIAKAVIEQQCELSEAAIRICRLLEKVYLEHDAHYPTTFPALHELDSLLADYPTHAGYKELKRQERMRFDVKRAQWEERLKGAIEAECEQLRAFTP